MGVSQDMRVTEEPADLGLRDLLYYRRATPWFEAPGSGGKSWEARGGKCGNNNFLDINISVSKVIKVPRAIISLI